jgi:lipopolysaccharide export LptBFGC system permease protein LptF
MKLLDRYVGKQVFTTALFAIAVLSLVLVLGNIFKQLLDLLVNHDVPLEYIISFIAYILPFSLTFTIPWGFLTAVLLVFGKMSAENELIALRSSGVSITRICVMVFVLALGAVGICLWINVEIAPRAQQKMKEAVFNIATSNPIAMFGSDQVIDEFPGKKIYVEKKQGTELQDILMYEINDDGQPMSVVHAQRGSLETDLNGDAKQTAVRESKSDAAAAAAASPSASPTSGPRIILHLTEARYEQRDSQEPDNLMKVRQGITADKIDLPISLQALYDKNKKRRGLSQMTLSELSQSASQGASTAAITEINKRFSFSLASFAFALIAVPLAITAHRRETSIGFLFSLIIAFVYFFFIIIVDTVRNNPKMHPELLIWTPNIIFIGLGSFLFWRLSRK